MFLVLWIFSKCLKSLIFMLTLLIDNFAVKQFLLFVFYFNTSSKLYTCMFIYLFHLHLEVFKKYIVYFFHLLILKFWNIFFRVINCRHCWQCSLCYFKHYFFFQLQVLDPPCKIFIPHFVLAFVVKDCFFDFISHSSQLLMI